MSCEGFFDEYIKWVTSGTAGNFIRCSLVSNQKNGICSYALGQMKYRGAEARGVDQMDVLLPGTFEGDLTQLFSDRLTADTGNPFSKDAPAMVGVKITLSDPPTVLVSGSSSLAADCGDGVLLGSPPGFGFVISLQTAWAPP